MKNSKTFLMVLPLVLLMACNNTEVATQNAAITEKSAEPEATNHEAIESSANLTFNNGVKWQSDKSTRIHAGNLNAFAEKFSKQNNVSLEAYHAFANDMQNELNQLVKGCQMKGADHNALHLWLEPVITEVKELKKVSTTAEGKRVAQKLTEDVKKFNQYFS